MSWLEISQVRFNTSSWPIQRKVVEILYYLTFQEMRNVRDLFWNKIWGFKQNSVIVNTHTQHGIRVISHLMIPNPVYQSPSTNSDSHLNSIDLPTIAMQTLITPPLSHQRTNLHHVVSSSTLTASITLRIHFHLRLGLLRPSLGQIAAVDPELFIKKIAGCIKNKKHWCLLHHIRDFDYPFYECCPQFQHAKFLNHITSCSFYCLIRLFMSYEFYHKA